jgi:uncharacterized protein (TIGR00290 family)
MTRPKIWLSWSSGKDSAWTLHKLRTSGEFEVAALLTTINQDASRVAMHAVREELLEEQARAAGVPLVKVPIPARCSNLVYEAAMAAAVAQARAEGVCHMAFGDLFLEDIRRYREEKLGAVGVTPVFPIWGLPTAALAREMVAAGLRAYLTCVDPKKLDRSFAGRLFDRQLLDELPAAIDPCGENGEFHSFAFAGPMFSHPVGAKSGQIVERDGFVFADVLGESAAPSLP